MSPTYTTGPPSRAVAVASTHSRKPWGKTAKSVLGPARVSRPTTTVTFSSSAGNRPRKARTDACELLVSTASAVASSSLPSTASSAAAVFAASVSARVTSSHTATPDRVHSSSMRCTPAVRRRTSHATSRRASVPSKSTTGAGPSIDLVSRHERVTHVDHPDPVQVGWERRAGKSRRPVAERAPHGEVGHVEAGGGEEVGGGEERAGVDLGDHRPAARRLLDVDAEDAVRVGIECSDRALCHRVDLRRVDRPRDLWRGRLTARREEAVQVDLALPGLAG